MKENIEGDSAFPPPEGKKISLMVEGRRRSEKRAGGLGCPPILPRLLPGNDVAVASQTSCSFRLPNETKQAPDLFCCSSCGRRFPSDEDGGDHIVHLRSQWRVVLLCGVCLDRVKSAALCSYCFSPIANVECSLSCLRCSRQVHLRCGDLEHRCIGPWRLDPGSFTCIDCCAIQNRCGRNLVQGTRVCPDKVVTESSFVAEKADTDSRFREDGFEKITADIGAAERASYASDVVPVSKRETPERNTDADSCIDEEIALQLHLAIDGSRRISGSSDGASLDLKACASHGDRIGRVGNSDGRKYCKTVYKCSEDVTATTELGQESNDKCSKKSIDDNLSALIEDQRSCFSKDVTTHGEEDPEMDCMAFDCERKKECVSVLYPSTYRRDGKAKSESLQKDDISTPDKYLKKYSRRRR